MTIRKLQWMVTVLALTAPAYFGVLYVLQTPVWTWHPALFVPLCIGIALFVPTSLKSRAIRKQYEEMMKDELK